MAGGIRGLRPSILSRSSLTSDRRIVGGPSSPRQLSSVTRRPSSSTAESTTRSPTRVAPGSVRTAKPSRAAAALTARRANSSWWWRSSWTAASTRAMRGCSTSRSTSENLPDSRSGTEGLCPAGSRHTDAMRCVRSGRRNPRRKPRTPVVVNLEGRRPERLWLREPAGRGVLLSFPGRCVARRRRYGRWKVKRPMVLPGAGPVNPSGWRPKMTRPCSTPWHPGRCPTNSLM